MSSSLDLLIRRSMKLGNTTGGIYLDMRNVLNRRNVVAVRRDTGEPQPDTLAIQLMAEDDARAFVRPALCSGGEQDAGVRDAPGDQQRRMIAMEKRDRVTQS